MWHLCISQKTGEKIEIEIAIVKKIEIEIEIEIIQKNRKKSTIDIVRKNRHRPTSSLHILKSEVLHVYENIPNIIVCHSDLSIIMT